MLTITSLLKPLKVNSLVFSRKKKKNKKTVCPKSLIPLDFLKCEIAFICHIFS